MSVLRQSARALLYFAVAAGAFAATSWLNKGDAPTDALPAVSFPAAPPLQTIDNTAHRQNPVLQFGAHNPDRTSNRWAVEPQLSVPQSPLALDDDPPSNPQPPVAPFKPAPERSGRGSSGAGRADKPIPVTHDPQR